MSYTIRRAAARDIPRLHALLTQVCRLHHAGRPDLFRLGEKYTDEELAVLLTDASRPVLAAVDAADVLQGYAFCILKRPSDSHVLRPVRTLYIDDLCVDAACRGKGLGRQLYAAACELARAEGCYNVTLNVWECNAAARRFYEELGMRVQKTEMEQIL